ncbi:MAG: hypothetical protein JKX95_08030 [Bacteroidia bacterium]|nr:hypothetical protein [Bacteroidia bacterium]
MTEVRHSITHSNSVLNLKKMVEWSAFQQRLFKEIFSNDVVEHSSIVIATIDNFDYITEKLMQHAQVSIS